MIDYKILSQIDLDQVLEADKFYLDQLDHIELNNTHKKWMKDTHFFKVNKNKFKSAEFFCFRSMNRADYKLLFNMILDVIPANKLNKCDGFRGIGEDINLDSVKFVTNNTNLIHLINADSVLKKQCLYFRLCQYLIVLSNVIEQNFKYFVSFSDMQAVDNLIIQYLNHQNFVQTITLQHGLYVEYKDVDTINIINYKNQVAHYFLSWGMITKELISKYHPDTKIVVCGKPTLEPIKRSILNYITVILDQLLFEKENKKMLSVASKYAIDNGYLLNIRFHPQLKESNYENMGIKYQKSLDINKSVFVIGHTSSLLYEMLCLNIPVYKYKSTAPAIEYPFELTFSSVEELDNARKVKCDFLELSKKYISYIGDDAILKYKPFFNSLIETSKNISIKISIITVVYNDRKGLEKTINSVKKLNYKNFEFIVIDGNSNDGTLETIKNNTNIIDRYVSERDSGIYDAMNRGIKLCDDHTDYVIFMNAGDEFADSNVLNNIFENEKFEELSQYDVVYGDRNYVDLKGKVSFQKARNINTINERMAFGHQSVFVKRKVLLENLFNTTYKNAADYNQFCTIFKNQGAFLHVPVSVCNFYAGGASENGLLPYLEVLKIQVDHFGFDNVVKNSAYLKAFKTNFNTLVGYKV